MAVGSTDRAALQRMDLLRADLASLKSELAQAWTSPGERSRIPTIERRIQAVWSELDELAVHLSDPMTSVAGN